MSTFTILTSFVRRDWAIARSYRLVFVLGLIHQLFQVTLFFFLNRLIDPAVLPSGDATSVSYFSFVVIGLIFLNLATTAISSFSSNLRLEQSTGSLEAVLMTPTPASLLILGSSSFDFIRSTTASIMLFGISIALFGLRPDPSPLSILAALGGLIASIVVFAALGVAVAAFTVVFKRGSAALDLLTSALALLGGVFFPVELFPGPLRVLAEALPFTWGITLVRGALLEGTIDLSRLLLLSVTALLALPASLKLLGVALQHARRSGSLAQY